MSSYLMQDTRLLHRRNATASYQGLKKDVSTPLEQTSKKPCFQLRGVAAAGGGHRQHACCLMETIKAESASGVAIRRETACISGWASGTPADNRRMQA
ncbi:MAG: hypothetical protein Q4F13_03640 [Pseudomonadota bacterium]|nr:hypothetical protein [Pseudomonadota bacterium]